MMKTIILGILILFLFNNNLNSQKVNCIDSIYNDPFNEKYYKGTSEGFWIFSKTKWKDGYMVLSPGDTLFGEVKVHRNGIHVFFRDQKKKRKLRADKYFAFKYGEHFFKSKKFDKYHINVEVIEEGPINMYAYEEHSEYPGLGTSTLRVDKLQFYVEKGSNVYGPFNLNWKDILKDNFWIEECFGDCPYLMDKIPNDKVKYADLLKACKAYNCWSVTKLQ